MMNRGFPIYGNPINHYSPLLSTFSHILTRYVPYTYIYINHDMIHILYNQILTSEPTLSSIMFHCFPGVAESLHHERVVVQGDGQKQGAGGGGAMGNEL